MVFVHAGDSDGTEHQGVQETPFNALLTHVRTTVKCIAGQHRKYASPND